MEFTDQHDKVVPAPLPSTIQVSWSQPRAWHGDTVTIRVRTSFVKNGSNIEILVFPDGSVNSLDGPIAKTIQNNQLDHQYKIDWKGKVIPANTNAFKLTAKVVELNLTSALSEPMLVDLSPPLFSA